MKTWIPFKPENSKTRLANILNKKEREEFATSMLLDVYEAIEKTGEDPIVLSTKELSLDIKTKISTKDLSPAVNSILDPPIAVVMSDLPLVNPKSLKKLFEPSTDLVIAPGRGGGTNAFVSRSSFKVDYGGSSFIRHLEEAEKRNLDVEIIDSFRLSTDMDERQDLVELLIHGEGRAKDFLEKYFKLSENDRAYIERKKDLES